MRKCKVCDHNYVGETCPRCVVEEVADASNSMDQLIQEASVPNLASLFRRAKETGAISSVSMYGEGAFTPAS